MTHGYRGRHRVPSTAGRTTLRLAVLGGAVVLPFGLAIAPADAAPDWGPIIKCESGGNPTAQNRTSTASGAYQFLDSTWRGLGGTGRAKDASFAEQTRIANKQYALSGFTAWNASRSCWAGKVSAAPARVAPAPTPVRAAPKAPKVAPRAAAPRAAVSAPRVAAPAPKARALPRPTAPAHGTVRVNRGDTLSTLAAHNGTTWRKVWNANRGSIPNPHLIYPGQAVRIP